MANREISFKTCRLVVGFALCFGGGALAQSEDSATQSAPSAEGAQTRDPAVDEKAPAPRARARQQGPEERRRKYPRRFDLRPQFYQDDNGYRFGVPAFDEAYGDRTERAYRQGLADGRHYERFDIQAERGYFEYRQAMANGNKAFTSGKYGLAARQFLLACTLNQGDPVSRLSAALTQIALREYGPAARLLRRAFDLQPKLIYLPMDIRGAYGNDDDFSKHLSALSKAASSREEDGDLWFVLGYAHYYSNNMPTAAFALRRAVELLPNDRLAAELADLARMSSGGGEAASNTKPAPKRE